jgi:hypothetical protein
MINRLRDHPTLNIDIECSGETHRLKWQAGELAALDHDDLEGERAFAALGGSPCVCIEAVDAWARHIDNLDALILSSRGPTDVVRWPRAEGTDQGRSGVYRPGSSSAARRASARRATTTASSRSSVRMRASGFSHGQRVQGEDPDDDLLRLLALNPTLTERFTVTVAAVWANLISQDDPAVPAHRAALIAALHGRAVCSMTQWLGSGHLDADVDVEMIRPDEMPRIFWDHGSIHLRLPFEWIVTVWGRGAAVVVDRFTIGVIAATTDELTLLTVGRSLTDQKTLNIRLS